MTTPIRDLVAGELAAPVDPQVTAMAQAIAAAHGGAAQAVLFYGSCLRQAQLDGLMLDFYLIVSDYRAAYDKRWLATANRLVPPNVFYFEHGGLVAKYAVLDEADFRRECGPDARSTSVVARFAQPSRLVWAKDDAARAAAVDAIAKAAPTLLGWAAPLAPSSATPRDLWLKAFQLTFGAELRAERGDRSAMIVDADADRYERFGAAAMHQLAARPANAQRWWKRMQRKGKLLSVARLAKATATFAGGADYIVWKINRHAGTAIELKPWQRRWPLLAGITLLPRLLKTGAVR
ncbi:hypothetical protein H8M03_08125 [Sphingomonas sabuli]|uniref:Phosphatidate cytidylyltransferase n=1 Tax=Sphingomonas sabuli TaxID=2764186 RepID=A0A7G9L051_9SPHN|nr:hypothetical protein [Sphingomonas sabuli]QNM82000.1 hypothetical protein H8M03_08125 [Sphingomonas sabuli]